MFLPNAIKQIRLILIPIVALSLIQSSSAQVGSDTTHWKWTPSAAHHDAVVQVKTETGVGTGVIVHVFKTRPVAGGFEGLCLTANHVVSDSVEKQTIKVVYGNGKKAKRCKVVSSNEDFDIALLWVWVPATIEPAVVAPAGVEPGETLEFSGLGGGSTLKSIRHFGSESQSPTDHNLIYASVALLPGDSGGPVFNAKSQVVGIISGGWFWFDGGVKSRSGHTVNVTWPARACNRDPLAALVTAGIARHSDLVSR